MLSQIYELTAQDVSDFNSINAQHPHGPIVMSMSYSNNNPYSSVIVDLTGTPSLQIPANILFTDLQSQNLWTILGRVVLVGSSYAIQKNNSFDATGNAKGLYAQCISPNIIDEINQENSSIVSAGANTLTQLNGVYSGVSTVTNPDEAMITGRFFSQCVDKKTIDDPLYSQWRDAMESNQPIDSREVFTIMV